ncbi:hypothetical protein DB29_01029 [Shouchella clausii]|nr:hypothetical protein DB29_01029 [Shouchella clausii]
MDIVSVAMVGKRVNIKKRTMGSIALPLFVFNFVGFIPKI